MCVSFELLSGLASHLTRLLSMTRRWFAVRKYRCGPFDDRFMKVQIVYIVTKIERYLG